MADVWNFGPDNDDDDDDYGNTGQRQNAGQNVPSGLRKHVRAIEKQLQQVTQERDALKVSQRTTTVADVVKAKGYDPNVAKIVPKDVEPTEDAVGKWLEEHSAFLVKANTTDSGAAHDSDQGEPDLDPGFVQAMGMLNSATSGAVTASKPQDLLAKIKDPSLTREQFDAILREQGAKF